MNAAKRKQPAGPLTRLVAGFVPFLQGPWLAGLTMLGLVGALVGGAFYGWDRWGADILQRPSYVLTADQIEITPPPSWIRSVTPFIRSARSRSARCVAARTARC